jgi:hypothetical protein
MSVSGAMSRVRMKLQSNVVETVSVSIIRVDVIVTEYLHG